ncbi:hypothetical protein BH11MYX4_BH11MYX4_45410 [soil metagenome]
MLRADPIDRCVRGSFDSALETPSFDAKPTLADVRKRKVNVLITWRSYLWVAGGSSERAGSQRTD